MDKVIELGNVDTTTNRDTRETDGELSESEFTGNR